jgi:hypothetical protein
MFGLWAKRDIDPELAAEIAAEKAAQEAAKKVAAIIDAYDNLLDRASPTLNDIALLPAPKAQLKAYLLEARRLDEGGGSHEALEEAFVLLATFQPLTPEQANAAEHCDFLDELQDASRKDPEFKSPKLKEKLLRYSQAMDLVGPIIDKVDRESKRLAAEWAGPQL